MMMDYNGFKYACSGRCVCVCEGVDVSVYESVCLFVCLFRSFLNAAGYTIFSLFVEKKPIGFDGIKLSFMDKFIYFIKKCFCCCC